MQVFYNESIPEYSELIGLFGFNAVKVTNASTYNGQLNWWHYLQKCFSSNN